MSTFTSYLHSINRFWSKVPYFPCDNINFRIRLVVQGMWHFFVVVRGTDKSTHFSRKTSKIILKDSQSIIKNMAKKIFFVLFFCNMNHEFKFLVENVKLKKSFKNHHEPLRNSLQTFFWVFSKCFSKKMFFLWYFITRIYENT